MLLPYHNEDLIEAGVDEAGRGCLAGPVFAAAVILPKNFSHPLLNDSKQLSKKQRYDLRPIIEQESIAWSVANVDNFEIDRINILQASFRAMHLAIAKLKVTPELLLIDGNKFLPFPDISHQCIVKGDATYASIAAASVLAKTYRDDLMIRLHKEYPQYGWDRNKGYGTLQHRHAMKQYGRSPYHRRSFHLHEQPSLFD